MIKSLLKKSSNRAVLLLRFLRAVDISFTVFLVPFSFAILTSLLEGLATGLFLPIARGVLSMDFSFVAEMPFLGRISKSLVGILGGVQSTAFTVLLTFLFLVVILKNFFLYVSSVSMAYESGKVVLNVRKHIFKRYLCFGKMFFDRSNKGYLQNVLLFYTNKFGDLLKTVNQILINVLQIIVFVILLCSISVRLTFISILVFPTLYFVVKRIIKSVKNLSKKAAEAQNSISKHVFNILSCVFLVKLYGREDKENIKFFDHGNFLRDAELQKDKKVFFVHPLMDLFGTASILLLVSVSAWLVVKDPSATVSGFLVYFYIAKRAFSCVGNINHTIGAFAGFSGPMRNITRVFEDDGKFIIQDGSKIFTGLERSITVENLNFSYRKGVNVLKDVTFELKKDEVTALVGSTGSGKTTIINLLMRFYDCGKGKIFIDGHDIVGYNASSIRRRIALVSQDTLLFNDTLRNNIVYGIDRELEEEEFTDVLVKTRLMDFIMELPEKADTIVGDHGIQLSGGEKQRVSIARALLKNSDILILDEATSAMDSKTEILIQEAISAAIVNKTVIVIAHRLSTIRNAHKVIVLENGCVVEQGTRQQLLSKDGKFSGYWKSQIFY